MVSNFHDVKLGFCLKIDYWLVICQYFWTTRDVSCVDYSRWLLSKFVQTNCSYVTSVRDCDSAYLTKWPRFDLDVVLDTRHRVMLRSCFSLFKLCKSINAYYLINEASYQNNFALEPSHEKKSNFVPKGIPVVFKMTEKIWTNRQTNRHAFLYL